MSATLWQTGVWDPPRLAFRVLDEPGALAIPAVGRAVAIHQLVSIMEMQAWRGKQLLDSQPRILSKPDPARAGAAWFVSLHVQDWLLSGNALHLVTHRSWYGWPDAVRWFPAHMWQIMDDGAGGDVRYWLRGREVPAEDVVHVRRGADPWNPSRGIGIVEQFIRSLNRAGLQEDAETHTLQGAGVPSVAIIAPQSDPDPEDMDAAAAKWSRDYAGPGRKPVILPKGSEIKTLSWSANDAQAAQARQMTLTDVANMTNLDAYWLGAQASSHTYRSPGPMWLTLLNGTLEPVLALFEEAWSEAWLPQGQQVRFLRSELTRDDLASTVTTMKTAVEAGLLSRQEARDFMGWDPSRTPDLPASPAPSAPADPAPIPEEETPA